MRKSVWVFTRMLILIKLQWLIHFSSSLCIFDKQTSCWLFTFTAITCLFRSLADGNCLHSAVSVRLVGNDSLIYTLGILTSIKLFLNCDFYSMHPALIDVHNNGKTVPGEKHFTLIDSVFELATGLRPFEIGNENEDLVALVKNEAKLTCTDKVWSSFSCVSALSSVICQPTHLFYSKCGFVK